jgi:MFS transporter, OFA family, oxalate/formate antiporter
MSKRWIQFGSALICMVMIANLQYAWASFVKPLQQAHKDWGLVGIQTAECTRAPAVLHFLKR